MTPLTLLFILLAGAPSATPEPVCRVGQAPRPYVWLWVLPDGELTATQAETRLRATYSRGSGFASSHVVIEGPGRSPAEVDAEFARARMADSNDVPAFLQGEKNRKLREAVEDLMFGRVCDRPDPLLRRLQHPSGALEWLDGTPTVTKSYTVYVAEPKPHWVSVHAYAHTVRFHQEAPYPHVVDSNDRYELLVTRHGALVRDRKTQKYAWLWVFAGHGYHKLHWESVLGGHLDGTRAVLDVRRRNDEYFVMQEGTVVVDLKTGATAETYVPFPENYEPGME